MSDIRDLLVRIKGDTSDFKRSMSDADKTTKATEKGFGNLTAKIAAGSFIGNAAVQLISRSIQGISSDITDAVKRVDVLNNANRTFQNMGFQTGQVKNAMNDLDKSIRGLPTPLDQAVSGVTMLASANNDIGKSQKVYSALNDAILGFGGTTDMVSNAVLQLSQDVAGGVLHAQTWNSMLNSGLGPTLAAIARQMGLTTQQLRDGLSTGQISVDKFQDQLIQMDEKGGGGLKSLHQIAKDSTNGISTSFQNARTAIVRSLANIINSFGQANVAHAITDIGNAFATLLTAIGKVMEFIISHKPVLAGLLGALAGIATVILISLAPAIWGAVVAFGAMALAAAPFILIGAAIGVIAYEIVTHWATLKKWFGDFWIWITGMFSDIWNSVKHFFGGIGKWFGDRFREAASAIKSAFGGIGSFFSGVWNTIVGIFGKVGTAIGHAISGGFKAIINTVIGLAENEVNGFVKLINGAINIINKIPKVNIPHVGELHMPRLAAGGIVDRATIAMIGEGSEPEAVIPLSKLPQMVQKISDAGGNSKSSVSIKLDVNVGMYAGMPVEKREIALELWKEIVRAARAQGVQLPMIGAIGVQ